MTEKQLEQAKDLNNKINTLNCLLLDVRSSIELIFQNEHYKDKTTHKYLEIPIDEATETLKAAILDLKIELEEKFDKL